MINPNLPLLIHMICSLESFLIAIADQQTGDITIWDPIQVNTINNTYIIL